MDFQLGTFQLGNNVVDLSHSNFWVFEKFSDELRHLLLNKDLYATEIFKKEFQINVDKGWLDFTASLYPDERFKMVETRTNLYGKGGKVMNKFKGTLTELQNFSDSLSQSIKKIQHDFDGSDSQSDESN